MKITAPRSDLARALKLAASTADPKSTLPVLGCVCLVAEGKKQLHITATDLTVGITSTLAVSVGTPGKVAVDARALLDRVASLSAAEVTIARDGSALVVTAGRAAFRVPCLDGRDFPAVLAMPGDATAWPASDVVRGLASVTPAICQDQTRIHLAGVYVDGADLVATDGHRLLVTAIPSPLGAQQIVPAKGVAQILKTIGDADSCEIAWSTAALFVKAGDVTTSVKLIDAQFPPWRQVVPTSGRTVRVRRAELAEMIDRARKVAGDSDAVVMSFATDSQEIAVSAHHADRGDYTDAIEIVDDAWPGAPLAIHFNGRYVAEALGTGATDHADLMMPPDGKDAQLSPFVVVVGETRGTVMPMRPK